jgi:OFA family oxalate/formate antiporter-like MFS transporter
MTKRQGLLTVAAAVAIQLTLGIAYLWSLFQKGIADSIFNGDHAAAALTFSLLLATLTIGSVIGGKLAVRYKTRLVVFAGGIILSAGFFLASFVSTDNAWLMWVTYGIMGGVGMGFTYSTTIACAQKWYPHKKGLVTGIIVAALGFGGVIFTPVIENLIKAFGGEGVGEANTFIVLSAVFLVVCTIGSIFLKNPPKDHMSNVVATGAKIKAVRDYSPLEMCKTPKFYIVTFTYMLACMGGLMMIAFAKPIAEAKGFEASVAAIGVLALSLSNSCGRLLWGMISDKIGRKNTILVLLSGNMILSLLVTAASGFMVFVLVGLIGFFYGGLMSVFPALTADLFGAKNLATNYGFVLLGFGAGAIISSQIAGYFKNVAEASGNDITLMFPAFVIASCCAAGGIVMIFALKVMSRKSK